MLFISTAEQTACTKVQAKRWNKLKQPKPPNYFLRNEPKPPTINTSKTPKRAIKFNKNIPVLIYLALVPKLNVAQIQ